MNTFLIILAIPTVYYLLGWWPGRPIKRKNNRWQAWGPGDQIWGYLNGDKPSLLSESMPPGFGPQLRELKYTKDADITDIEEYEEETKDGRIIKYGKAEVINGITPIRWVTEQVTRLRKKEIHPYLVPIDMPNAGFKFYLRLLTTIEVFDPMKTLDLDQFLMSVGTELKDAAGPWGPQQEVKWLKKAGLNISNPDDNTAIKNLVVTKMLALNIDDHKSIKINGKPLMEYINSRIEQYGIRIIEFSLNVGYDDSVKQILTTRALQQLQDEKTVLQEKENQTNVKLLEKEKATEDQRRTLDKLRLQEVTIPEMKAAGDMLKTSHEGFPAGTTLFMGASDDADITNALLQKISKNTQKQGGTNAQP